MGIMSHINIYKVGLLKRVLKKKKSVPNIAT